MQIREIELKAQHYFDAKKGGWIACVFRIIGDNRARIECPKVFKTEEEAMKESNWALKFYENLGRKDLRLALQCLGIGCGNPNCPDCGGT